jgi:hypothetical protein
VLRLVSQLVGLARSAQAIAAQEEEGKSRVCFFSPVQGLSRQPGSDCDGSDCQEGRRGPGLAMLENEQGHINIQPLLIDVNKQQGKRAPSEMAAVGADPRSPVSSNRKLKRHTSAPIFCPQMSFVMVPKTFPMRRSVSMNQFAILEEGTLMGSPRQYGGLGGCEQIVNNLPEKAEREPGMRKSASAPCLLRETSTFKPFLF